MFLDPGASSASASSFGERHGDPPAWYGDTAYGTGELREAIAAAGH